MCFKEKTIKLPNNSSVYKFYSFPAKTIIWLTPVPEAFKNFL